MRVDSTVLVRFFECGVSLLGPTLSRQPQHTALMHTTPQGLWRGENRPSAQPLLFQRGSTFRSRSLTRVHPHKFQPLTPGCFLWPPILRTLRSAEISRLASRISPHRQYCWHRVWPKRQPPVAELSYQIRNMLLSKWRSRQCVCHEMVAWWVVPLADGNAAAVY